MLLCGIGGGGCPALRTDAGEDYVMGENLKAMTVPYPRLQILHIWHVHIKYPAAGTAFYMIVGVAHFLEAVRTSGQGYLPDLAFIGQSVQIPVHRRPAESGVIAMYHLINLIRSGVSLGPVNCFQYYGALNRLSSDHTKSSILHT